MGLALFLRWWSVTAASGRRKSGPRMGGPSSGGAGCTTTGRCAGSSCSLRRASATGSAARTSIPNTPPALAMPSISPPWPPQSHIRATIEYAATQPWIDKDNLLLAGESAGGFGSIVAAGERLPGVKALVNFAGGVGGSSQYPCNPQNVELQLVKAARRGAIPSIWFYAENDRFWGAKLPRAWHAAYVEAGGTAEFHMLPPLQEDGHEIIGSGYEHWRPRLDHFLTSMGFAPRKLPDAPRPTGFAPLGQAPPVPALFARCLERYDVFLKWDVPRAFALSPTGDCAYAAGELDVMASSLKRCEQRAKQACKLYAVNDEVVWVP